MPTRKRQNLSRNTAIAKRLRSQRDDESVSEREERLGLIRNHQLTSRLNESSQERESRLRGNALRTQSLRNRESSHERESRLRGNALRTQSLRSRESSHERESRLRGNALRTQSLRNRESSHERESRLRGNALRTQSLRNRESSHERESRLRGNALRTQSLRSRESSRERRARLREDRARHAVARSQERDRRADRARHAFPQSQASSQGFESPVQASLGRNISEEPESRRSPARAGAEPDDDDDQLLQNCEIQRQLLAEAPGEECELRWETTRTEIDDQSAAGPAAAAAAGPVAAAAAGPAAAAAAGPAAAAAVGPVAAAAAGPAAAAAVGPVAAAAAGPAAAAAVGSVAAAAAGPAAAAAAGRRRLTAARRAQAARRRDTLRSTVSRQTDFDDNDSTVNDFNLTANDISDELQPWTDKHMTGFSYNPHTNYANASKIGGMCIVCTHCRARKWKGEPNGICCSAGKVVLDALQEPPEPLKSLLLGQHPESKPFLSSLRAYNSVFRMTSFGGKEVREGHFMPCFKIQGQVYHRMGSLLPADNATSSFLQIYFISDHREQADTRMAIAGNLNASIVMDLQNLLHQHNTYVRGFKAALESLRTDNQDQYKLVINADRRPANAHPGCYNAPACSEVAVLLVDEQCGARDIVLRTRDHRLQRIAETHRAYDSLQYPLMFCRGEDGYHFLLRNVDPDTGQEITKKTSALQFYSYRIMVRDGQHNYLLLCQNLLNQFLVDMYAKIEAERLRYFRTHQSELRAENYVHLMDALRQDGDPRNLGQRVILPATFTGGPRNMHNHVQDAFVYVRKYGRPDLFITMTTNPKWEEITNELPGQVPHDRHDIMSRVFHLKLKKLMDLLTKENIFGTVRCFMFTIEWQKRGLPHAHILLWLEDKIRPNQMDQIISAELPNPESDPALFEIVRSHMIHGPCGTINPQSPCMKDGRCTKKFPKRLTPETITGDDGYPTYRRRSTDEGGSTATLRIRGQTVIVDNKWIVPFSPVLLRAMKTHLNVEFCGSVRAIQYLCKYITKGSDHLTVAVENENDEIMSYQTGRYISTSEAVWRILAYSIHERFPPVLHLDVHLENGQRVYFDPSNAHERVQNPRNTTLTAFFELCNRDDFAKGLLYEEIPAYYTFDKQRGVFNRRRRGVPVNDHPGVLKENTLGRVYTVHPNNSECFYLRLLLHTIRGPTSFADLRKVDGVEHETFQGACAARNLLQDDRHWDNTLEEACVGRHASQLRQLFAILLVFCQVADAKQLWDKYRENLAADLIHDTRLKYPESEIDDYRQQIDNGCLLKIQDIVIAIGGNALEKYGLPSPQTEACPNREYAEAMRYDTEELSHLIAQDEPSLTNAQKHIYEQVLDSVTNNRGITFFLDAPGGTGKTYLINLLLNKVRSERKIALAVASSGIAATLLPGGKTAHSSFDIPITTEFTQTLTCQIDKESDKASVIKDCVLVIWDECTMAHKISVEAVDRMFRDFRDDDRLMGGVTFLFCGDFRQTLPVVPNGTRADEVNACLKRSAIWTQAQRLTLDDNMRARLGGNSQAQNFSKTLLSIGDGSMHESNGQIELPSSICVSTTDINAMINFVYPGVNNVAHKSDSWLCQRAILAPKNDEVIKLNNAILAMYDAPSMTYRAVNTVVEEGEATIYPTEFLNSLKGSGLPAHELTLKVGAPIMLMRNLHPPMLCNGTRVRVTRLQSSLIEGTILTGCGRGESVLIPRVAIIPSNYPFKFKRVQFPVSVCFAMTINKSQGQTLETVGVDLRTACFSHGQLYVALSRARARDRLCVCAPTNQTTNVVYREVLA